MATRTSPEKLADEAISAVTGGATTDVQNRPGGLTITADDGADFINAGSWARSGDDHVSSGGGNDRVDGGMGNDYVDLGTGDDHADGGAGDDTLYGNSGQDELRGEAGNDSLDGGIGDAADDWASGYEGDDTFRWAPGDGNDFFEGGPGADTLSLPTMDLYQLKAALTNFDFGLRQMVVSSDGVVTFRDDATGQAGTFSGFIQVGGETLAFVDIEKIRIRH